MLYPQEKIDEIRDAVDIVDIISEYVSLKKKGRNYFGLCPFHQEKTPSFSVSQERQMYRCFGCGEGGTVFTFLMKVEKMEFPEVVETLAKRAGIVLKKLAGHLDGLKTEYLFAMNEKAAEWYHKILLKDGRAEEARNYIEKRDISIEIVSEFGLGYAPSEWDSILKQYGTNTERVNVLEKVGLIIPREKSDGYYDRFRNRIMFPIRNESGKVVGFGGRAMPGDEQEAKYVNTPETQIYQKGKLLYGLYQHKNDIQKQNSAVLVEGYTDLLALSQAGFRNVIAPLGTALTPQQAKILTRYAGNVTLVYDSDEAGLSATMRGVDILIDAGLDVDVVLLEKGHDPDSIIKEFGAERFQQLIDDRIPLVEFWAAYYKSGRITSLERRANMVKSILGVTAKIRDTIKRGFLLGEIADKFGLNVEDLRRELKKITTGSRRKSGITTARSSESSYNIPAEERELLHLIFSNPEAGDYLLKNITIDNVENSIVKRTIAFLLNRYEKGISCEAAAVYDAVENEPIKKLISLVISEEHPITRMKKDEVEPEVLMKQASDVLKKLRKRALEKEMVSLQRHLKEAESKGEDHIPLLKKYKEYEEMRKQIIDE